MAAWGYVPTGNTLKDFLYRFVGLPHPAGRVRAKVLLRYLERHKKWRVLDLGCGEGTYSRELSLRKVSVTGIDVSLDSLKFAVNAAERINQRLDLIQGDAQKLPFKTESFDEVMCLDVIEHVFEPNKVIAEVNRVLKPKGVFILSVPTPLYLTRPILPFDFSEHIKAMGHIHEGFFYEEVKEILEGEGFRLIKHEYYGKWFLRIFLELFYLFLGPDGIKKARKSVYKQNISALLAFSVIYLFVNLDSIISTDGMLIMLKAVKE
ncbi:MAG: class I SAM-dependent methyltransferase [Candidatus Altiarchaeota archaeon]|nr:class I SAM-dependent methyltransferase [Candidatus Altiarchaeota archaeon]